MNKTNLIICALCVILSACSTPEPHVDRIQTTEEFNATQKLSEHILAQNGYSTHRVHANQAYNYVLSDLSTSCPEPYQTYHFCMSADYTTTLINQYDKCIVCGNKWIDHTHY